MPFIRQVRDKRGYETTYVMHAYRPLPGPQRTRILYLFRSPSHIRFGRRALDEEAREALEHTHPDVSFDWTVLGRESAAARPSPPRDRDRYVRPRRPAASVAAPVESVPPVSVEDQTALGRAVGGEGAVRLRARYAELVQRIMRRARTPEDRDRLLDLAQRLNPDDWPDEATARTAAPGVEAAWDALVAELPARRRGRRGGRRRPDGGPAPGSDPDTPGTSVILAEGGGDDDDAGAEETERAGSDRNSGPGGDGGPVGPEPGAVPDDH